MNKFELMSEKIQEQLEKDEITLEQAEQLNNAAFKRYITESKEICPKCGKEKCICDESCDSKPNKKVTKTDEKSKTNKYIEAHKILKESTDELKSSITEAANAGFFDKDAVDYLFSIIE